jgi:hypothetical protein
MLQKVNLITIIPDILVYLKLVNLFSVSDTLPSGQLSNVPWRRSGVKYTNNEAYFDVIEEVDAIIDRSGQTVSAEIHGYVRISINFYSKWIAPMIMN